MDAKKVLEYKLHAFRTLRELTLIQSTHAVRHTLLAHPADLITNSEFFLQSTCALPTL